ncbi:MAG: glycerol-3-phosphate dehydrogenase/oxidase [Okeania sp. SIO2C2]|uniref:glycerol-3-phosphate dehydrogenase/oxidase n=1 Tax=Okeania sp. SIO2C2 TaxID=2607787 RepID=UPI0013BA90DF|nr:glycerol-3-phosphate dehydrogenase/oxidase [Okeania sp. SIO2C2]NEP88158.1 glycerol-3-phosphate dehydrogenase/oxidase [Okeania sp. SIO2C2]
MKRDINKLTNQEYDLLIVGGGVYGAACAWDASIRGLSVALLERDDFGWAASSNSAKIAHSGSRYLQHADFKRMRESIRERSLIADVAPHLIDQKQPFMFPIYGHGIKGRETMTMYFAIYDLLSIDYRRKKDPARAVPNSYVISKEEVLKIMPGLNPEGLTGGVIWYEGQMHNTERLTLSRVLSASERGADVANYTEVVGFIKSGNAIVGVEAKDRVSGEIITVRAKTILNTTGAWIVKTLNLSGENSKDHNVHASKAFSFITRPLSQEHAIVISHRPIYDDEYAIINKKSNLSFAIPWRGHSLIGSLHLPCDDDPNKVTISEAEIKAYIDLINEGYPAAQLRREDILHILWGIIPADKKGSAAPLKHYEILDHLQEDGWEGVISVVGVKYTTARDVAQKAIDLVLKKLKLKSVKCSTHQIPVWGGDIEYLDEFTNQAILKESERFNSEVIRHLVRTYGSNYAKVLSYLDENPAWAEVIPNSNIIQVEVIYAIREEMAEKLVDVVLRRTDLGTLGYPGDHSVRVCGELMAKELNWNNSRLELELQEVIDSYIIRPTPEVVYQ